MVDRRPIVLSPGGGSRELGDGDTLTGVVSRGDVADDPRAQNLLGWTFDPIHGTAGGIGSGRQYFSKIWVPRTVSVTNLHAYATAAGSGLSAAGTNMALYGSDGTRLGATAELSTAFATAGLITAALAGGPVTVTGGPGVFVWAAAKVSGTTLPQLVRALSSLPILMNVGLTAATGRAVVNGADSTTTLLPANITPASNNITTLAQMFWFGLS